jgi:purine-binding chemotaxis protein CheW
MTDPHLPVLICRIGALNCALSLSQIVETMRPLPVRPMPGMPPFVTGLARVRGEPVLVVDGATLLGEAGAVPARFVTLRLAARRLVLAVTAVVGIRSLDAGQLHALPPLLKEAPGHVVSAIGARDAEFLYLLDTAWLLPDAVRIAAETAVMA